MTTNQLFKLKNEILTEPAKNFLTKLHQKFSAKQSELLNARAVRAEQIRSGAAITFLPQTKSIREAQWQVASAPHDLNDRRVEITGPAEAKMIINAMNCGAKVFMADLEDALSPSWENILGGHLALTQAVHKTLSFESEAGKKYSLNETTATLIVRPRGLHLIEENFHIEGQAMSASLFDFGLYFFHNAKELLTQGRTPAFYLPKLESHLEARFWNDVFVFAQTELGVPTGSLRATVLIETILAAFEMEEILFELKGHAAGLNAGRWDYIFSLIKKNANNPKYILPDRAQVTMATGFMSAYAELLVQTCHRRGAHAIGGMAAFIPSRKEPEVTRLALEKVKQDKAREAALGFDGSWVAHPDLVAVAQAEFDLVLGTKPNQKEKIPTRVIQAEELLDVTIPGGQITETGIRNNINVSLQYIERWLSGLGAVAIHNLMEDAATAEISRSQLWQWLHHSSKLSDGRTFTRQMYLMWRSEELQNILKTNPAPLLERAKTLLDDLVLRDHFTEFLTSEAYHRLLEPEKLFINWSLPQAPISTHQGARHE